MKGERGAVIDGWLHPDFGGVADALRRQLRTWPGGAAVCVYHRGECVVDLWGGDRDREGRPWIRETMAPSFSTTKGVAATLLHVMVDRGLLDYDDRVADYWPEFAQAGKERITVRHVLAHQSGLYHIRQMIDHADRMLDWEHMVAAIERAAPMHPPGTRTGYHGLTFGFLVGEILQRVTGRRFPDLVQEELAAPLELDGLYVGAPSEAIRRAAELIWPERPKRFGALPLDPPETRLGRAALAGVAPALEQVFRLFGVQLDLRGMLDALAPRGIDAFDFGSARTLSTPIPAANGLFTARSLARMYAALASGGSIDGVRLLSPKTLSRATRVQSPTPGRAVMPYDMRWRLGYHGVLTTLGVPRNAFGHFGFGGSGAWACPRRQLAVALIVNSGMGTPFGDLRVVRVGGATLACADARPVARPRPLASGRRAAATGTFGAWAARRIARAI
jgi:CubicO group peptidase (beta-lactamase class C family)